MGLLRAFFKIHIILEEDMFYNIFSCMPKKRETLDVTLMTWKNMEEIIVNYCNFQNLIKILSK